MIVGALERYQTTAYAAYRASPACARAVIGKTTEIAAANTGRAHARPRLHEPRTCLGDWNNFCCYYGLQNTLGFTSMQSNSISSETQGKTIYLIGNQSIKLSVLFRTLPRKAGETEFVSYANSSGGHNGRKLRCLAAAPRPCAARQCVPPHSG